MKTIKTTLYTFDQLPELAKEKAIKKNYDINVDCQWWDNTYLDAENIGLQITSFDLERNRHAKGHFINSGIDTANKIIKEHGSECSTFKTAQFYITEYAKLPEIYEDSEEIDSDFLNALLNNYAIILQDESDYLQSKEGIIETFKAHDYYFNAKGEIDNSEGETVPNDCAEIIQALTALNKLVTMSDLAFSPQNVEALRLIKKYSK